MLTWTTITLTAAFLASAGVLIDRLLLHRKKPALHHKLTGWWLRLDASKIQEIPKLMAEWVLGLGKRIFKWPLFSWQSLVLILIASWILTTASATLGNVIDMTNQRLFARNLVADLPFYWIYLTNLPFDIITILVTVWVLGFVQRSGVVKSVIAVLFDIMIATLLVWICMASISWVDDRAVEYVFPGSRKFSTRTVETLDPSLQRQIFEDGFSKKAKTITYTTTSFSKLFYSTRTDYVNLLRHGGHLSPYGQAGIIEVFENQKSIKYIVSLGIIAVRWGDRLIATTSFIPTFAYMTAMLIFLIAAMMVKATMHLLEVATQSDPRTHPEKFKPFTLLGSLFGLLAIFVKLMAHLVA